MITTFCGVSRDKKSPKNSGVGGWGMVRGAGIAHCQMA